MRNTIGPVCSVSYSSLSITSLQFLPQVLTGPEAEGKRPWSRSRSRSRRYFTTDSQSWYWAPLWDLRPDISCRNVAVWNLLSCIYWAPSLMWERTEVWGHLTTDGRSVIMSRYRAHSGTCDQILLSVRRLFSEISLPYVIMGLTS
jgi:hypothetical protein